MRLACLYVVTLYSFLESASASWHRFGSSYLRQDSESDEHPTTLPGFSAEELDAKWRKSMAENRKNFIYVKPESVTGELKKIEFGTPWSHQHHDDD